MFGCLFDDGSVRTVSTSTIELFLYNTPEIYWRRFVFLPFLDHLIQEFDKRFIAITRKVMLSLNSLPNNVGKLTYANITVLQECYSRDLPYPVSMSAEVSLWKNQWDSSEETKLHSLHEPINVKSSSMFTNIFRIFHLLMLISVTSAGVERASSALTLVQTVVRCTVHQDRLDALVLLHVRKDVRLDIKAIIDKKTRNLRK